MDVFFFLLFCVKDVCFFGVKSEAAERIKKSEAESREMEGDIVMLTGCFTRCHEMSSIHEKSKGPASPPMSRFPPREIGPYFMDY